MSRNNSDSSTSESEVSACSSNYNPMKALHSNKTKIPVKKAPFYDTIVQYEAAQSSKSNVLPCGEHKLVMKREEEKELLRQKKEKALEEANKQRFAKYQGMLVPRTFKKRNNVLSRIASSVGPLGALKECVDKRLRIKVVTRNESGIRGVLHANLVAFDKQWNLALTDVLETWTRKKITKRKIPPLGTPVPRGTAAGLNRVPQVTEKSLGNGLVECSRYLSQILMRGEHVVIINLVDG